MARVLVVVALGASVLTGSAHGVVRFTLWSPSFPAGGEIPARFTCLGQNRSPSLRWIAPPPETRSFALLMDDPDAPGGTFTHWLAWNVPAKARRLVVGQRPPREGRNDAGRIGYAGPCPPSGTHRYVFRLYALKEPLALAPGAARARFLSALDRKVLATARLVGRYGR